MQYRLLGPIKLLVGLRPYLARAWLRHCLKDKQRKAILVLERNHCYISLITGYGKSQIFLVLLFVIEYCIIHQHSVLIVHQLSLLFLALMKDQYKPLNGKGVATEYIGTNSDISDNYKSFKDSKH